MDAINIQDRSGEKNLVLRRAVVAVFLVFLMCGALLWRMFFLQVIEHDVYVTKSTANRVQVQPIAPTRGLIYDRNGNLLAENLPSHRLSLVLERIDDLDATLAELRKYVSISDREEERFRERIERYRRPYEPVELKDSLTEEEIARIAVNNYFLKGVEVDASLIRRYPYGTTFSHALGYVGKINEAELKTLDPGLYAGTNQIGKVGVEKTYENDLLGTPGYRTVEINARGRILRTLDKVAPVPGTDLKLYLDLGLQQKAQQLLEGQRGAIVAMDPKTGGIMAMVSSPSFDPNLFVTGISSEVYSKLRDSRDVPFLNRTTRGLYPPASTIKPFLGLGALKYGVVTWNTKIYNPGYWDLPTDLTSGRTRWRDWTWRYGKKPEWVDLHRAIMQSVDTYFYEVAYNMKLEAMHDTLASFGFGEDTTLDVYNVANGINPTREWKKERQGFSWFAGDSVNMGIGQGYLLASPLQVTAAMTAIVNDGEWKTPRLEMSSSRPIQSLEAPFVPPPLGLDKVDYEKMKEALRDVMHGPTGTGRGTGWDAPFKMGGKTGTAQVFTYAEDELYESEDVRERLRDHAWFTGFAPYEDPQIVVTVFVENGEHSSAMAKMARAMFEYWLLPETDQTAQE